MQKIFNHFLKEVSAITEIEEDVIMSRRKDADIVDARAILVYLLHKKGFSTSQIARKMKITKSNIHHIINNHFDRVEHNPIFYNKVKQLLNNLQTTDE